MAAFGLHNIVSDTQGRYCNHCGISPPFAAGGCPNNPVAPQTDFRPVVAEIVAGFAAVYAQNVRPETLVYSPAVTPRFENTHFYGDDRENISYQAKLNSGVLDITYGTYSTLVLRVENVNSSLNLKNLYCSLRAHNRNIAGFVLDIQNNGIPTVFTAIGDGSTPPMGFDND